MNPSQTPRSARGFTMVELIIVISLIGILAAVGATRLGGNDQLKARAFVNDLGQVVSAGQRMAVAQRRTVYALVVTSPGSFKLCFDAACSVPVAAAPGDETELRAPAGMALQASSTAFNFDGIGRPSITAPLTLSLLAADGSALSMGITVQAETGYVATF